MSMQVYTATCTINHVARIHGPVGHIYIVLILVQSTGTCTLLPACVYKTYLNDLSELDLYACMKSKLNDIYIQTT